MKFRRFLITLAVTTLVICHLKAQVFYTCDVTRQMYKVSLNGRVCSSVLMPKCTLVQPFSIAIYKDTMYSIDYPIALRKSVIVNDSLTSCSTVTTNTVGFNSMTVDSNGTLYGALNQTLYKVDRTTGVNTALGVMPYLPAGDCIFYEGSLYLTAFSPVGGIVKVNIANPGQSTMFIPMPGLHILGMVVVPVNCNTNKVYVMSLVSGNTELIEVNMNTQTVVGTICSLPYTVYDAASSAETGISTGVKIQRIQKKAECKNLPGSGSIQVNMQGQAGSFNFLLNNSVSNNTGVFMGLSAGTYPLRITAVGGCVLDTLVTIATADTATLMIHTVDAYCGANNGSLSVTASGAVSPYQYSLNGSNIQASGNFTGLGEGNYQLQVKAGNQCVSTVSVPIAMIYEQINPIITISAAICSQTNAAVLLTAPNASSYSMNGGAQQLSGQFSNLAAEQYRFSIFTARGCRKDTLIDILSVIPGFTQTVTVSPATCNGRIGSISINPSSAVVGFSLNNGLQQSSGQFYNLLPGAYKVSCVTANGCRNDTVVQVPNIKNPRPSIQFATTSPDCHDRANGSLSVTITGSNTPYLTSLAGGTFGSQSNFFNLRSGAVTFRIQDADGCLTDTLATIPRYVLIKPIYTVTKKNPTCLVPLSGSARFDITWSGNPYSIVYKNRSYATDHMFGNLPAGNLVFAIKDAKNCTVDSAVIALDLIQLPECDTLYVPTAFTPNGDGQNDIFRAVGYGTLQHYEINVYNRLGTVVFSTKDITRGWDGKWKGSLQPQGAYIWMVKYRFASRREQTLKGTVLMIQ